MSWKKVTKIGNEIRVKLPMIIDLQTMWSNYQTEHPDAVWTPITYTDDEDVEHTVIDEHMFWGYLIEKMPNYRYEDPQAISTAYNEVPYQEDTALRNFRRAWVRFINLHPEYARLAQMMDRTDYDPLENYDRKEDGGWKDTMDIGERQRTVDDDSVHMMEYDTVSTTTENDPKIKTKTVGKVYPDDGSTAMNDTESITEPVRDDPADVDTITTTTPTHTDQSSVEGDHVTTDAETQDVTTRLYQDYHVHGNIGVTTAAQMIEGELKVREKYNLCVRILEAFAGEVLTLRKEVVNYDD